MKTTVPVSEIFGPTIAGEGSLLGLPTVFVRTGGCDFRCSWCDSLHAVLPEHKSEWRQLTPMAIWQEVAQINSAKYLITLSGGNPAIHSGLGTFIAIAHANGVKVNIETQGTILPDWAKLIDIVTLSPKPPSSKMVFDPVKLEEWIRVVWSRNDLSIKIPIFDEVDFQFAKKVHEIWPQISMYLSVGNTRPPLDWAGSNQWEGRSDSVDLPSMISMYNWLWDRVIEEGLNVRITPQMHVLARGNARRV